MHTPNSNISFCRSFPIDMAGFAVHVNLILSKPKVKIGFDRNEKKSKLGYLESDFLEHFANRKTVECLGSNKEVIIYVVLYIYVHS